MPTPDPPHPPLIAIFGPTASGKSALGMAAAAAFNGEIVSADSRQVYRYMDIGTDKPSMADRERVRHHMIDIVNPDVSYTLALYQEDAYHAINDILARGRVPFLVGGTPLYVNAVTEGWTIPRAEPDPAFREALYREAEIEGPGPLYTRLQAVDAAAAAGILPSNTRRIIRALEVIHSTGNLMSAQQSRTPPPYSILPILLQCDRTTLYNRIDSRVDSFISRGLVEEVRSLHERGYSFELPSMSGIGYRQIGSYLSGKATLTEAIQRIKWDTHAFVRHQGNWFRRVHNACQFDVTEQSPVADALVVIESFLREHGTTEPDLPSIESPPGN